MYTKGMANSKEYMREYMKTYSAKRRLKALAYLGGVCVACGTTDDLEIDHVDPSTKSFTLARGWHHAWSKIETELDKCQILCKPCHDTKHGSKWPCGTAQRYWRGCRCKPCTTANSKWNKNYLANKDL